MDIQDIINNIAAGDNLAAKEAIEDVLSNKTFEALQTRKQEIASTLFSVSEQQPEETVEDQSVNTTETE